MKIIRYQDDAGNVAFAAEQNDGRVIEIRGDVFAQYEVTETAAQVHRRLAPIVPSMIWCIGLNYRHHAEESGMKVPEYPVIFAKSPSATQGPDASIQIPRHLRSDQVDYEGELAVVIGRTCKNASRERALDYVLGYTCGNDVSAREWQIQRGGTQWCRGKTFDTFAPLGPYLVTTDEIPNPNALRLQTRVNGVVVQDHNTNDMIFDVPALIEFLSGSTTLLPGTVIFTGTPKGVGMARKPPCWLKPGDTVAITIEKIGTLTNTVEFEA